jgi:RNA polymerase sigma-70 factor (ECF subfamily)
MPVPIQTTLSTETFSVPSSFEEAYRENVQCVARWAYHLGGANMDVEDVVQDVFLVVSKQLGSFRREARFTSWLFEITRKIVANHRRCQRWRFWQTGNEKELASAVSHGLDPVAELERRQEVDLFYRVLDQMPEKYRTVLVLYEIEGLDAQAIADICHLNLSTVRVQLARARERFIKRYQQLLKKGKS